MSKIKELEEQLAAAKASQAAAEAKALEVVATSAKQTAAIEARFKALEDASKQTVGERFTPGRGPILATAGEMDEDPMGEDALEFLRSRNLIKA